MIRQYAGTAYETLGLFQITVKGMRREKRVHFIVQKGRVQTGSFVWIVVYGLGMLKQRPGRGLFRQADDWIATFGRPAFRGLLTIDDPTVAPAADLMDPTSVPYDAAAGILAAPSPLQSLASSVKQNPFSSSASASSQQAALQSLLPPSNALPCSHPENTACDICRCGCVGWGVVACAWVRNPLLSRN